MKKIILILIILTSFFSFSQKEVTRKGMFKAVVNDSVISNHTRYNKADISAENYARKNGFKTYKVIPYDYDEFILNDNIQKETPLVLEYLPPIIDSIIPIGEVMNIYITQPINSFPVTNYDLIINDFDTSSQLTEDESYEFTSVESDITIQVESRYPEAKLYPRSNTITLKK